MIGIRGHRGAGKNTLSFLLGTAIEHYTRKGSFDGFHDVYNKAVMRCRLNESFLYEANFRNVYYESFADIPKVMVADLVGVPTEWAYDDWLKDSTFICINTFEVKCPKDKLEREAVKNHLNTYGVLYDASNIKSAIDTGKEAWLSLRELISYFSHFMRENMGTDVWIKALKSSLWEKEKFFTGNKTMYKIFVDCKFPSEISYIKNNGGVIVKTEFPGNMKPDTSISSALADDPRYDYLFNMQNDLFALEEDIKSLALKLVQNDKANRSI